MFDENKKTPYYKKPVIQAQSRNCMINQQGLTTCALHEQCKKNNEKPITYWDKPEFAGKTKKAKNILEKLSTSLIKNLQHTHISQDYNDPTRAPSNIHYRNNSQLARESDVGFTQTIAEVKQGEPEPEEKRTVDLAYQKVIAGKLKSSILSAGLFKSKSSKTLSKP